MALFSLVVAATQRLNLWGILYLLLVGWLRFAVPRDAPRLRAASWLGARALLGVAVALQYLAALSLPPTVLPAPDRRPWSGWGDGWLDSTGRQLNGTCARLGSVPADGASGLVCWLGLDGGLPVHVLWVDLAALCVCTLCCAARRAVPDHVDAPMGGPRLAWAERWVLRVGHVIALLLSFSLSSLAALQQASGLLWMGYLLLSLLVLVRGTWRATIPSRRRHGLAHSRHSRLGTGGGHSRLGTGLGTGLSMVRRLSGGQRRWRWEAAVGGGAAWRAVHRYAWAVPLVVVAYQAPLLCYVLYDHA